MTANEVNSAAALRTILAVEDDCDIRRLLCEMFSARGYRVLEADQTAPAVQLLEDEDVGVALLDERLRDGDNGLEVLSAIASRCPHTKAIVLTANASTQSAIDSLRLGAFDYIDKPFDLEQLVAKVERAFEAVALDLEQAAMLEKYHALFETIPGIVFFTANDGEIRRVNEAGAELLGYRPEQVVGQSWENLVADGRDVSAVEWGFKERRTGKRATRHVPVVLASAGGERRTFELFSTGVWARANVNGRQVKRLCGTVGVAFDTTERQRSDELIRHAQKMEAIGTLAGGVAHEMNNILAVVLGLASAIEADVTPGSQTNEDARLIVEVARRGAALTRNLLGFARRTPARCEEIEVNSVVSQVTAILQRTIPKRITLSLELASPSPRVAADNSQLTQALMNICLNSIDAIAGKGEIRLRTTTAYVLPDSAAPNVGLAPGEHAIVEVIDNGVGVSAEHLSRIFDPFFTTKEVGRGTGLGLSFVHGVVCELGGTVQVDSTPASGTSMRMFLPLAPASASEALSPKAASERGTGTVLLVDDEPLLLRTGGRLLKRLGYEVLSASNGVEAIDVFRARRQDISVVLLDLAMPEMDGFECFARLRELDPNVRVIVCSGFASGKSADSLLAQGACTFLPKPFEPTALAAALLRALAVK